MRTVVNKHEHDTDPRSVVVGTVLTLAASLTLILVGQNGVQQLSGVFVVGGLALLGCWGAMAFVQREEHRAIVRGLAFGIVLGLVALLVVLGTQTVALPVD